MAEDYELSEDGTSITLYIRQGVKFQDGTELTAEDVAFSLNRQLPLPSPRPTPRALKRLLW